MATKEEVLNLKKGDKISYKDEGEITIIENISIKDEYPDIYGEVDKCVTINGLDWYFDEITIRYDVMVKDILRKKIIDITNIYIDDPDLSDIARNKIVELFFSYFDNEELKKIKRFY